MKDPFVSMLIHAFIGAFVGSLGALIMVCFIGLVQMIITGSFDHSLFEELDVVAPLWPAMSMGSIVGAILGGIAGLRKAK